MERISRPWAMALDTVRQVVCRIHNWLLETLFVRWILICLHSSAFTKIRTHHVTVRFGMSVLNCWFVLTGFSIRNNLLESVCCLVNIGKIVLEILSIRWKTPIHWVYISTNRAGVFVHSISAILMTVNRWISNQTFSWSWDVNCIALSLSRWPNKCSRVVLFGFVRGRNSCWVTSLVSTAARTLHLKANRRLWG